MSGEKELKKAYESILGQHFEEAAEWFRKAIERDPNNAEYHYKLSITYARSGKIDEALTEAREALSLCPDRPDLGIQVRRLESKQLSLKAEPLLGTNAQGDTLAVVLLRQALQLDPIEESLYLKLAAAYSRLKEFKEAIAVMKELLELNPNHRTAYMLLNQYKQQFADYLEE